MNFRIPGLDVLVRMTSLCSHGASKSSYLTPCDFFLGGHIQDFVFVPPLPKTLEEFRERIHAALMIIGRIMLQNVWNEFDYRLDVCRVTLVAHIEYL
ncbi:hypothetical protein AVEN_1323-1 [Araneus ventricosus]|uniref:Uncharacterized protein n=1 Tax=Araneus ventricosus TaxID=182803 RepID=A0A4Y2D4G1_ARAVE|nr:hypothetical protein AVEN_1323-1 [Araneus ventricosus]